MFDAVLFGRKLRRVLNVRIGEIDSLTLNLSAARGNFVSFNSSAHAKCGSLNEVSRVNLNIYPRENIYPPPRLNKFDRDSPTPRGFISLAALGERSGTLAVRIRNGLISPLNFYFNSLERAALREQSSRLSRTKIRVAREF